MEFSVRERVREEPNRVGEKRKKREGERRKSSREGERKSHRRVGGGAGEITKTLAMVALVRSR
jgi:hypothetical protein